MCYEPSIWRQVSILGYVWLLTITNTLLTIYLKPSLPIHRQLPLIQTKQLRQTASNYHKPLFASRPSMPLPYKHKQMLRKLLQTRNDLG